MCVAVLFTILAGCAKKEPNIIFTGTIETVSDRSILVSTADDVSFDKASVSFAPDMKISFNLLVGQVVKITILPQIAESYPVQVTAVAIELVSAPVSPDPALIDYTASYYRADSQTDGGWDFITARAMNADALAISSIQHIPAILIKDFQTLSDFISEGSTYFQFSTAYSENESFVKATEKYDAAFFEKNTLLILYTEEPSGSIRHTIKDVTITDDTFSVAVEAIVPEIGTDDMANWFILLELPQDETAGITKYDAYYP